ncbi:phosphatase PAP2 family protein [Streptomyces sp. NPDC096079]|uniref:phosphatase PAP2 family protein n=1 Tax=Streptomyces sp. NPDC096079 TaxID=3155820 RepID=UPI003317671C
MDRLAEAEVEAGPARRATGRAAPEVLPASLRGWLGPVAALAALAVVALGVLYAGHGGPGKADRWIQPMPDDVDPRWWDLAHAVDFLGEPAGAASLVAAAVALCLLLRSPRAAVLVVAGVGLSVATTTLLKPVVGRTIHGDDNLSYPSGHTAFLTAFALTAALLLAARLGLGRAVGTLLVLVAALLGGAAMGWAQVVLSAHYPTDTLGGWCTALAVVPATAWLVDRAAGRMAGRRPGSGRRDPR